MGVGKSTAVSMPPEIRELHVAVMKNDIVNVLQLVDAGIDVNYPWQSDEPPSIKDGSTPLCEAVSLNHRSIMEVLIAAGAVVNKSDNFGCTPLHKASYHGRAALVDILIKAGADVQLSDQNMNTPLQICAQSSVVHNNVDTIRILIQAGANVNARNRFGKSPLHYAVIWGLREMTDVLIKADSLIDNMDYKRKTPLYCCIRSINVVHRKREVFEQHLPAIKVLITSGCDSLNLASWLYKHNILTNLYHMDEEFYHWYCSSRPGSLKQLCRQSIQSHVTEDNITKIKLLTLPKSIADYLCRKLL